MMRQQESKSKYKVIGENGIYTVILARIKNDVNGNPRYSAEIVNHSPFSQVVPCYTFTGHYSGEQAEAEWIVKQYESK